MKLTKADRAQIVKLRRAGTPYKEIAKKFGITSEWARQVAFVTKRKQAPAVDTKSVLSDLAKLVKMRHQVERLEKQVGAQVKEVFNF